LLGVSGTVGWGALSPVEGVDGLPGSVILGAAPLLVGSVIFGGVAGFGGGGAGLGGGGGVGGLTTGLAVGVGFGLVLFCVVVVEVCAEMAHAIRTAANPRMQTKDLLLQGII
jgi:hypothetical protein